MTIDEGQRIEILADYQILDTGEEDHFDQIVEFARKLCDAPIALVSLVDSDRQWFKARRGLAAHETPRSQSFCAHAMFEPHSLIVPDALEDARFANSALVTGDPNIRFYAGIPLVSPEGAPLGSLCVIDNAPRKGLSAFQLQGLTVLAQQVVALMELRRRLRHQVEDQKRLAESDLRFRVLADTMPQMVWSATPDGKNDYFNARWYEFTGVAEGATDGEAWDSVFHPDDRDHAWQAWRHSLATGEPYEIEYRMRHRSGEYRWTLGRALAIRDGQGHIVRWFGTCTDIHETKSALEQREILTHELSHRIKNIFAVIGGLISLSARTRPEIAALAEDLRTRILALGRAHDFVRPHGDASQPDRAHSSLHGLLEQLFAPYDDGGAQRIHVTGDDPDIDDRSATPLALLFHELATNASKYGALSVGEGRIAVSIARLGRDCIIDWRETGGPPVVKAPELNGFGSQLISLSISNQLRGVIEKNWDQTGLHAHIRVPLESLARH